MRPEFFVSFFPLCDIARTRKRLAAKHERSVLSLALLESESAEKRIAIFFGKRRARGRSAANSPSPKPDPGTDSGAELE